MGISLKVLRKVFGKQSREYVSNKFKANRMVDEASDKAEFLDRTGPLDDFYHQLQLLFSLIKDWINGTYRDIPKGTLTIIIMGILYFLSPFDFIFDFIPGAGFLDDAFVLGLVVKKVNNEIEKYKYWKQFRELDQQYTNNK